MKKWSEESSDFLDALGGNAVNPLTEKKKTKVKQVQSEPGQPEERCETKKKITTIHIDEQLYREFKSKASLNGTTITAVLENAIKDYVSK